MAHKGKTWPVLFRRDLNLNVETNDDGWSNRVIVTYPVLPTGFAGFWSLSHWDCGPGGFLPPNLIEWKSELALKFGLHWFTRLEVAINNGIDYTRILTLNTIEFGVTAKWLILLNHWMQPTWQTPFVPTTLLVYDPAFFDTPPNDMFGLGIRPKVWSEGPPH